MGSISHQITPLVINSLGGQHTQTNTHAYRRSQTEAIRAPGLTIASYNVFSVVLVFSMLSLGCILISDLVVANLLMYSLPGMILLYLAASFFTPKVFLDEIY